MNYKEAHDLLKTVVTAWDHTEYGTASGDIEAERNQQSNFDKAITALKVLYGGTHKLKPTPVIEPEYKLHTANYGGNLHAAADVINKQEWAEFVHTMSYSGVNTVVVFKMPAELVDEIKQAYEASVIKMEQNAFNYTPGEE